MLMRLRLQGYGNDSETQRDWGTQVNGSVSAQTKRTKPDQAKVMQLMTNPPAAIVSLADSLFVAMAMHQLKAEQVHAYSTEVLALMQARVARKWVEKGIEDKLVLDPKEAFLLSEDDAARFSILCEEKRIASKLEVNKPGNCPALEAETLFRAARDAFIDALTPYTGITLQEALTAALYNKLMDWGLRLMAPHVDPHKRFGIPQTDGTGQPSAATT